MVDSCSLFFFNWEIMVEFAYENDVSVYTMRWIMVRCAFREFKAWHGMGGIMMLRVCFLPCMLCMRHAFQGEPAMRAYWEIKQNRRNHSCVDIHTALNKQIISNAEMFLFLFLYLSIYWVRSFFLSRSEVAFSRILQLLYMWRWFFEWTRNEIEVRVSGHKIRVLSYKVVVCAPGCLEHLRLWGPCCWSCEVVSWWI